VSEAVKIEIQHEVLGSIIWADGKITVRRSDGWTLPSLKKYFKLHGFMAERRQN